MKLVSRTVLAFAAAAAVSLVLTAGASAQQQKDRTMDVANGTPKTLMNLYAEQSGNEGSRKNMLPASSNVPPGQTKKFNFDTGTRGAGSCMRDLYFDFVGAAARTGLLKLANVNICDINHLKLTACSAPGGVCASASK